MLDLNIVLLESEVVEYCFCGKKFVATLGKLLYQLDFGGCD
jgi:hypothetical protein